MSEIDEKDASHVDNTTSATEKTDDKKLGEYSYLETGGFSTEIFKIQLRNLPKYYGISELKKLMTTKLGLEPSKIKPARNQSLWLYICFRNEEDRLKAISALDGYTWKGRELRAQAAQPAPDPLFRKRKMDTEESEDGKRKKDDIDDSLSLLDRLKNTTTPYWKIPYNEQTDLKHKEVVDIVRKLSKNLRNANNSLIGYIQNKSKVNNGLICQVDQLKTGNLIDGYRNKCEFTTGIDAETKLPTVGFRVGSYVQGCTGVAPVEELCHIPDNMKKAVLLFQDFIRASELAVYSPEDHSGNWKLLTIRQSFSSGELMLVIEVVAKGLDDEKQKELKKELTEYFTQDAAKNCNIVSLYFHAFQKREKGKEFSKAEHLFGETHIQDTILDLNFRISPAAFFQINTNAAGILYQTAIDLAAPGKDSTVIDICCGTGTIGLCFAKHCSQVLGLELIPEAIADAKANAAANGIMNSDFFCGAAEDIVSAVLARATSDDIIAIVDPPRAGLHMRAIHQLRKASKIKKLIFLSCDPSAAMKNFIDLGRPASKTMHGDPFVPTRAVGVDMFPHTKHSELVFLFERIDDETAASFEFTKEKPESQAESTECLKE